MTSPTPRKPPMVTNDINLYPAKTPAETAIEVANQMGMTAKSGDQLLAEEALSTRTECIVDGRPIKMLAFKMTGVCSEYCRKVRDGEIEDTRGGLD